MEKKIRIGTDDFEVPTLNSDGNVDYNIKVTKSYLKDHDGKRISNKYFYIERINDEQFIVGDVVISQVGNGVHENDKFDESKVGFKYGVICLEKENGEIIPKNEEIVVPIIYDKISLNNLGTITACVNNHYTYVDIDRRSHYYGKQLVPAVLEHAVPFSVTYDGFAECSVNGVVGYLPRNCEPKTKLNPEDLLTKEQVEYLLTYFDEKSQNALDSFKKLTGNVKVLKKD